MYPEGFKQIHVNQERLLQGLPALVVRMENEPIQFWDVVDIQGESALVQSGTTACIETTAKVVASNG